MKSFFVNLGKLALCGAVVAMIGCTDLHSDIKLVQSNSDKAAAELQEDLDRIKADLQKDYALKSEVEAVESLLNDEIARLEAAMATDTELDAAIDGVNAAIDEVKENVTLLDGRLTALEEACEAYQDEAEVKALIAAEISALKASVDAADEAIKQDIEILRSELLAKLEGYATVDALKEVVEKVAAIEADYLTADDLKELEDAFIAADEDIKNLITNLGTEVTALKETATALEAKVAALEAEIAGLATLKENLEKKLDKDVFETYKKEVDAKLAELETMKKELAALGKELEDKYKELKAADEADKKALREEIEAKSNELNQHLTQVLNVLQDQVNDLSARVQSLVFIPEYSDGKATIEWGLLIDNDSAVNFLYNTVISYNTLDTFKTYAKKFIDEVRGSRYYAYIVRQMKYVINEMDDAIFGSLEDINAQLDAIFEAIENLDNNIEVDTPDSADIESAFNNLFNGIEDLVSYYVAQQLAGYPGVEESTVNPDEITANIIADLKKAFSFGDVDIDIDLPGIQIPNYKAIVKNLIKSYVKYFKAEGISKVKDIINALESGNISASDIIDGLKLVEFRELLSDLLPVAKRLEAMILQNTAILKKESVIRYKVLAQDAEAVAADIATNWKKVLYYDVEAVDVRAAAPALEITKVVAKGDEIHVTVLPQNFNYRFYLTYILEDSFLYGAAESFFDKFGKTGLISYSAALVLNDGNNIRSTEYVNFVSGENPEIFTPEVVNDANQVVETKKVVLSYDTESYEFCSDLHMAYLSVPKRVACTKADLEKQGYSGIVEKKSIVLTNETDHVSGPCTFNGFVGTFDDYYRYTFETLWSVNDITLVVKYDVSFE